MGMKRTIALSTAMGFMTAFGITQTAFAATQTTSVANFTFTNISVVAGSSSGIPGVISGPYELVSVTVTQTAPDAISTPSGPQAEDAHMLPAAMSFTFTQGHKSDTVTGVMASRVVSSLQPQVPYSIAGQPAHTWTTTYAVPVPQNTATGDYRIVVGESGAPVNTMIHYSAGTYSYYSGSTLTVNQWKDTDDPIAGTVMTQPCKLPHNTSSSPDRDNPGVGNQGEPPHNDSGDNGKGNLGDPGNGNGNQMKGLDGSGL